MITLTQSDQDDMRHRANDGVALWSPSDVLALLDRIAALEAQLAEAVAALEPFARLASHYMMHEIADTPAPSNDYIFSVTHFARPEIGTISAGDIRRAVHVIRTRSKQALCATEESLAERKQS